MILFLTIAIGLAYLTISLTIQKIIDLSQEISQDLQQFLPRSKQTTISGNFQMPLTHNIKTK
jgi:hypothetical protein